VANTSYQLEGNAAELYEKYTVPTGSVPAAEQLLQHVKLKSSDRVMDAACGTGIVARMIVKAGTQAANLVGLDLNESMLTVARSLLQPTSFPISWVQGDLCFLPFPDEEFDVVICNHGFQFVPDKPAAAEEIRRVLSPGGRFIFTVFSAPLPFNLAMADALRRHIGDVAANSALAPFAYRDPIAIRALFKSSGFKSVEIEQMGFTRRLPAAKSTVTEMAARSAYAKDVQDAPEGTRESIVTEVYEAMQEFRDGEEFCEPMRNFLVQATDSIPKKLKQIIS